MKPINTIPIETFLEKVRIASKTNQKSVNLDLKEASMIADVVTIMMSRLVYKMSSETENTTASATKIDADGGGFN